MELNACWSNFVAFNIIINALIDWIIKNCQENSVIFLKVKSFYKCNRMAVNYQEVKGLLTC